MNMFSFGNRNYSINSNGLLAYSLIIFMITFGKITSNTRCNSIDKLRSSIITLHQSIPINITHQFF